MESAVQNQSAWIVWQLDGRGCGQGIHRRGEHESPSSPHSSLGALSVEQAGSGVGEKLCVCLCVTLFEPAWEFNVVISRYVFLTNRSSRQTWAVYSGGGAQLLPSRQNRIGCDVDPAPPDYVNGPQGILPTLPITTLRVACVRACVCVQALFNCLVNM